MTVFHLNSFETLYTTLSPLKSQLAKLGPELHIVLKFLEIVLRINLEFTPFENAQRWMGKNTFPILLLNDDKMIEH